jgi:alpha-glucosidase (family GH31 glycosyl hydrolase)
MLNNLHSKIRFSGIWLDMNEVANFCDGPCSQPKQIGFDYSHDLPYNPGSDVI